MRRLALVSLAAIEWFGGAMFDVNGGVYPWWREACFALALVTLALAFVPVPALPRWTALVTLPVAAAALLVTTERLENGTSRAWPNALACIFFVAVAAAEVALLSSRGALRSPRASA